MVANKTDRLFGLMALDDYLKSNPAYTYDF